jgi:hypothetical protein
METFGHMRKCSYCHSVSNSDINPTCHHCGTEYPVLTIRDFVSMHCVGGPFDTCKSDSQCSYASAEGCTHPYHPHNQ